MFTGSARDIRQKIQDEHLLVWNHKFVWHHKSYVAIWWHEVIFEEFKGTGNAEVILDRKIADKRIFPAIDITKSGTRKEDLLFKKEDLQKMNVLRRLIAPMGNMEAIEFLIGKLRETKNNAEFFDSMNKSA